MNRLVVFMLVLVLALSVPASSLLAKGPTQTQAQSQTQTQTQSQAGDCVCDGPNCDGDCQQNSYQNQSGNAYQDGVLNWFKFMWKLCFGGGE